MRPRLMRALWLLPLLVAIRPAAAAGAAAAAGDDAALQSPAELFLPAPQRRPGSLLQLQGSTWTGEGPGFALRLQLIDDAQRGAYIEHVTGLAVDPFAGRPDMPPRYLNFVLEVENPGPGPLAFNPKSCLLLTNRKRDLQSPSGLSDLSFAYRETDRDLPAAYSRVGAALFDEPVLLQPGESAAGLLIYRAVHPKTKWLDVEVALSLSSGEVIRVAAGYEKKRKGRR